MAEIKIVKPQKGYQEKALSCPADILISGAAAGVGKTWGLLVEGARNIVVPRYGGVIFRRTSVQIRNEGGLWDTSEEIYPHLGGKGRESSLDWTFRNGTGMSFRHLEHEKTKLEWQGAQIAYIGFDELTHFTETTFFYLLSRNRSTCGVSPYVRATCNPDPDSWVAKFIEWWIHPETGYPIAERDGVLRYFLKNGSEFIWGDTKEEVRQKAWPVLEPMIKESGLRPEDFIKSLSFISGSIYDNKALLNTDPGYLGNLMAQDEQTKNQLLHGNWKMVVSDSDIYDYTAFLGMFDNVMSAEHGETYITSDIALEGSNMFVVWGWRGYEIVDCEILDKSKGPVIIEKIKGMADRLRVPNNRISFDADGVGGFIDGYIPGAYNFRNNAAALPNPAPTDAKDRAKPENYENLKAQCFYRSGAGVKSGKYKISAEVASRMYDDKMTIRQRFIYERKAIKKARKDKDGKLCLIKKGEMKAFIGGDSPDLMDAFGQREVFELTPKFVASF